MKLISPINNFDLIRLLAAVQVFIGHGFLFGFFRPNWVYDVTWFIPGVPVFFGMSGFLLLWSFERNPELLSYCKNRLLRLYPALWATMILTVLILLAFRTLSVHDLSGSSFLLYFFGRCTLIFSFVPQVIKPFAQGNPNGSLWTIGVELQFYALLPVIALLIRRRGLFARNLILLTIGFVSYWIDRHDPALPFNVTRLNGYLQILISEIRLFYYLFFFVVGMLFYVNYRILRKILVGKFMVWLLVYIVVCSVTFHYNDLSAIDRYAPDGAALLRHLLLMTMVFSGAFTNPRLAERVLKGNDYSYGMYLTHLLVLNSFYQLHRWEGWVNFVLAWLVTGLLAFLSWHFIEKRALLLKKHSIRGLIRRGAGRLTASVQQQ